MPAIAVIVSFASTAFLFRGRISGFYLGEIFDTRLMIVLHEHWFRFLTGKISFLDAEFFFPYPRSFALTDTFLLTGITHSFFRIFQVDIVNSWAIAQFIWIFIGLLGWFFFARTFLSSKTLQILIIPLIATSFPFVAHINERPNVIPYLLSSWVFFFIFNFYQSESRSTRTHYLGAFLISIPLIILTSWYAGFFIVIYILVLIPIVISLNIEMTKRIKRKLKLIDFRLLSGYIAPSLFFTSLWAFIYLPELDNSANNARPMSEVIDGSPKIKDIFNNSALGGGLLHRFFNSAYELGQEELVGISFLLTVFVIIMFTFLTFVLKIKSSLVLNAFIFFLAGLILESFILKSNNNISAFILLFERISFLKSIRTPIRWHIYLTFILIVLSLIFIDLLLKKYSNKSKYALLTIPILLLVDQYRLAPGLWQKDEFLSENLILYKGKLKDCSAFVLDQPETGMWSDIIESLALTTVVDRPSVLGYSGSRPKNFPSLSWYLDGDLPAIGEWLKVNDSIEKACFLDGINHGRVLKYYPERIEYSLGRGFTGLEKSKSSSWAWSVWESSALYLHSFSSDDRNVDVMFTLEIPDCLNSANFEIQTELQNLTVTFENEKSKIIKIFSQAKAWEREKIQIKKDEGFCNIGDDPRELYFSVKDVKITTR